jgi:hypothetical protein
MLFSISGFPEIGFSKNHIFLNEFLEKFATFVIICVKFGTRDPQIIFFSSGKYSENWPRENVCLLWIIINNIVFVNE